MYWNHARSAAAEDAWQRAAEYARRANDRRQLTEILGWPASAALWGPMPAAERIRHSKGCHDEIMCQGLSARILADHGHHAEALELASSAATLAAQTDLLSPHADALLDLAEVLAVSGRVSEAHAVAAQALDLYQRKGNLPGTRESLGYLTRYARI